MPVYLAKRALPRAMAEPPLEVSEDLARLSKAFGQQSLGAPSVSLNIKKLNHPDGAWRLRTGDWRSLFFQTGEDFLVAAIGPRRDIYERLPKIRLARWAGGIRILETETRDVASDAQTKSRPTAPGRGSPRRRPTSSRRSQPTPFSSSSRASARSRC